MKYKSYCSLSTVQLKIFDYFSQKAKIDQECYRSPSEGNGTSLELLYNKDKGAI